jgi:hypothetical protein
MSITLMKKPVGIWLFGAKVYWGLVQGEPRGCGTPLQPDTSQGSGILRYDAGAGWRGHGPGEAHGRVENGL